MLTDEKTKKAARSGLRRRKRRGAECVAVDTVLKWPDRLLHAPKIIFLIAVMVGECYRD
jgi:hypothetical protein